MEQESQAKILEAYRTSSEKLELIEQKYSQENQNLREKLNLSINELNNRANEIKQLRGKIKSLESFQQPVNEAV